MHLRGITSRWSQRNPLILTGGVVRGDRLRKFLWQLGMKRVSSALSFGVQQLQPGLCECLLPERPPSGSPGTSFLSSSKSHGTVCPGSSSVYELVHIWQDIHLIGHMILTTCFWLVLQQAVATKRAGIFRQTDMWKQRRWLVKWPPQTVAGPVQPPWACLLRCCCILPPSGGENEVFYCL